MASEDDDDSTIDEFDFKGGKSGTIFLIDSRPSMFTKDFTDQDNKLQTRFHVTIKCCRAFLMNRIIAKQKDLVGIVLFGTDKSDPKINSKHTILLQDFNYPTADAVKKLDKLLDDEDSAEFQRTYGSSDDFLLSDVLWYCSSLFSQSGSNLEEKQIMMFTDDSDPHASNPDSAHIARKRAKDLSQIKISLDLLPMGASFDYSKFYRELVEIVNNAPLSEAVESSSKLEQLLERVNRLDYRKRRYSKIKWSLGNNVSLGVSLYTLYKGAGVMPKESLYRATNEPVKKVRQTFDMVSGDLILPSDIIEYVTIGGSDIVFSSEEKEKLKKAMEPGITLLGFKPLSFASEKMHCGQSSFAYPEETLVKGSKELMKALVERCIAKQRVALCCVTPRNRAVTKYVCLVPCEETYDDEGKQLTPCGFHVVPLPFYNDNREQSFPASPKVDPETVEIAKKLINKLKISYKPSSFNNPKLQQFWTHLEALALEYTAPEEMEDTTVPDAEKQTARLGGLATEFNSVCSLSGAPSTSKRPATSGQPGAAKRSKTGEDIDINQSIKDAIKSNKVDKFTVAQLKEFLISHNKDVQGMRKPALVEAVYKLNL